MAIQHSIEHLAPFDLTTEYLSNPIGISKCAVHFAWKIPSGSQSAYQIQVASSESLLTDAPDLWDSGKVESPDSINVEFPATDSNTVRSFWRVKTWDDANAESEWSDVAFWEIFPDDLTSNWIGTLLVGGPRTTAPLPILRRSFHVTGEVESAKLYVTALGVYEARVNGQAIGDDVLAPGWTDYRKRLRVQTYDVASHLNKGENTLGAFLGDGWYCGNVEWRGRQMYGDRPLLLAELRITYKDGSTQTIHSDGTWKWSPGPIVAGDLLMGEAYDARLDQNGWDLPGFDDSSWHAVEIFDKDLTLVGTDSPMPKRMVELTPKADILEIKHWPASDYIFDLGQNMTGWVRLKVKGPAGTTIRLRFGEFLDKGKLYTENLRSALQTDFYTLKGDPEGEVWEPKTTFHGFQYVEVRGFPEPPTADAITGIVVYSALEKTGHFECSEPLVNQLQSNILWGQMGNFVDVPTDCPQRDERLGWTGDAQVFASTAAFNLYVPTFFRKYLLDLEDSQDAAGHIPPTAPTTGVVGGDGGPAWADAFVIVPWTMYESYGDKGILERHYPAYKKYVASLEADSLDLIRSHPDLNMFKGFADWLNTNAETPNDYIGTAFFVYSAHLLAKIAQVLGQTEDEQAANELANRVKAAFNSRFVEADGSLTIKTQTAALLALHFDLIPPESRVTVGNWLVQDIRERGDHLSTGFVGTPYINHVLTELGHLNVAYDLLLQKSWPSWLYPVTKGATTIWERWDGWTDDKGFQDIGMNSFNHYAYGAIGAWLYSTVAGIKHVEPAYKVSRIAPLPGGGLTHASASLETLYGPLSAEWKIEQDEFELRATIPPNTTSTLVIPAEFGGGSREVGPGTHVVTAGRV